MLEAAVTMSTLLKNYDFEFAIPPEEVGMKTESKQTEQPTRERGQALFLVMVTIVLLTLIGTAILQIATLNVERARTSRSEEQLTNAARVGLGLGSCARRNDPHGSGHGCR